MSDLPVETKMKRWIGVYYALFGRRGFTPAAVAEMEKFSGLLVDLEAIDHALGQEQMSA
jgi:hypothetical protein